LFLIEIFFFLLLYLKSLFMGQQKILDLATKQMSFQLKMLMKLHKMFLMLLVLLLFVIVINQGGFNYEYWKNRYYWYRYQLSRNCKQLL